jgi:phospholipase/lecithinase/hemolysin
MHAKKPHMALLLALLLVMLPVSRAIAAYSSLYVFGDGVCATNDPTAEIDPLYYGKRNCNGRVWVEVLWQWQGLAFDDAKNKSKFGHTSDEVVAETTNLTWADAATALFVIWCNDADLVEYTQDHPPPKHGYTSADISNWTIFIDAAVSRHVEAVTNLYNKGARAVVMPSAANIMAVPAYNDFDLGDKTFVRDRVMQFNVAFETAMADLAADIDMPGLTIYRPDTFTFFEQVLANPGNYGLVNPYPLNSARWDLPNPNKQYGPGINYVFWDDFHPTAAFQMHLAAFFQQIISPPKVNSITLSGGNVHLQVANIPMGRAGSVQGSANLLPPWQPDAAILEPFVVGGNTPKTISFAASGPKRFYRVGFPVVWAWP